LLVFELDRTGGEETGIRQELLLIVAELLHRHVRGSDYAAYWGDERFTILAPATDLTEAAGFAVKIRRLIAEHPFEVHVSASIGVAEALEDEKPHELLGRCERALLSAGSSGGNRIAVDKVHEDD
jgi:diguanylate cyclase